MLIALAQAHLRTPAVVGQGPPAAALWQRLRRAFPWTVAAALGKRSVVWLGRVPSVAWARQAMERVWSPLRRRLGWPTLIAEVREVAAPRVGAAARRIHGLGRSEDAALPGWSTARDLVGGVVDPWVLRSRYEALTWGRGGTWVPAAVPDPPPSAVGLDAVRAALRAPWLHASAPTVAGLLRGAQARARAEEVGLVPSAWVDAALRCALDPRLCGFPQPAAPGGASASPEALRPWRVDAARGRR